MMATVHRRGGVYLFAVKGAPEAVLAGAERLAGENSDAVMKMVRADLRLERSDLHPRHRIRLSRRRVHHRPYGLGENIVQGAVDPDEFYVHKPTFRLGHRAVLQPVARAQADPDGLRRGAAATTAMSRRTRRSASAFASATTEVLELADHAIEDRGALLAGRASDADGHRVGQGWPRRAALHHPGAARDGRVAQDADAFEDIA